MLKLFRFLKPYRLQIVGVTIFTLASVFSELYLPNLMGDIVNNGIVKGDTNYILRVGGRMLLFAMLATLSMIISSFLSSKTSMGFGRDLRNKVFTQVEGYSLNEFDKIGTASLITRTTNDINQVQQVAIMSLRMMIRAPLMLIGGIVMAFSKNKDLSIIFLIAAPVLLVSITLVAKRGFPLFKIIQEKIDKVNLVLREELTGIRVIRAFHKGDYEEKRFNHANRDLTETSLKVARIMALMMPLLNIILNLTVVGVLWYGSRLIDMSQMEVGDLMAFIQYVNQVMFSLIMVSMMFIMIPRAAASAIRINEVLDMKSEIVDKEDVKEVTNQRGFVEFKNVSFIYPGAENPALLDLSFATKPGETTAIIGGTGSGKTSLINLILRFYDINEGSISIGGVDIRNISQESLRKKIGLVSQKALLFSGSIMDNIRFGKDDASLDEIKNAAEIAQATDFIMDMSEGFDSIIAQGGTNLSGGQKQRLSIARALIRKPDIYVFDDSFSALDFKTDKKLRNALKQVTQNATVIIIAQRVSSVIDADNILVLDDGKIVGQGTHKELLKNSDVYREIVESQLSQEEIS